MSSLKSKASVLVTGGAGFIGSHLVEALLSVGNDVRVLDNLSSGRLQNLPSSKSLTFIQGDVRDVGLVETLVQSSEMVFHLAEFIPNTDQYGIGHVTKFSTREPILDFDVSARGTINVLESARKADARVIFVSTAAVYGEAPGNPVDEGTPIRPVSPYGASKACGELYANTYNRVYGLRTVVARFFNIYGPRQRKYVMYDLLTRLRDSPSSLTVAGTGQEERDFMYVKDAVRALLHLSALDNAYGGTFNLGSGIATSISELVSLMTRMLNLAPRIDYSGVSWKGDIRRLVADTTRLQKTGFSCESDLPKGLHALIMWFERSMSETEVLGQE
ncbi:MAG: NAD-dependent epimerase/dehydratase family protein [Candidatus Bathyarchaeia archaeon]